MNYLSRYILWNYSDTNDYKKFPFQEILNDSAYFSFKVDIDKKSNASDKLKHVEYRYKNKILKCPLDDLLESTGTTAFIIIKNDSVFFEK